MAKIEDDRKVKGGFGYVIFTDKFMSGWGHASGGRSLYALEVNDLNDIDILLANGKARSDMKRGRYVRSLRNVKLGAKDHLRIVNREQASRWYEPHGFCK